MCTFEQWEKNPKAVALKAEICRAAEQHDAKRFGRLAKCAEAAAEESILWDGPLSSPLDKLQIFLGEERAFRELLDACGRQGLSRRTLAGTERINDILDGLYDMSSRQFTQFLSAVAELLMCYEKQLGLDWDAMAGEMVAFAAGDDTDRLHHMAELAKD